MASRLINIKQCAERLGTNERHIRSLIQQRRIPYHKVGRLVRFDVDDLEAWLASQRVPASSAS